MIVSRLIGGLGNQMFQFAAGRALSLRLNVPFYIDRRAFSEYKTHAYGMECFQAELTDAPSRLLPKPAKQGFIQNLLRRAIPYTLEVYTERSFTFDTDVISLTDNIYLEGYWQSEKYFTDFADVIRADFVVRHPPSSANKCWLELASEKHSVSIHIRRGDYVNNTSAAVVHGVCDLSYYKRAVEHIHEATGIAPVLFVFSDDQDWVAENLRLPYQMYLVRDNNAAANYEDMRIMTACRHHVIANSSYSWWAAWLDSRPDSITIAPQRWFASDKLDPRDLVPERWVQL